MPGFSRMPPGARRTRRRPRPLLWLLPAALVAVSAACSGDGGGAAAPTTVEGGAGDAAPARLAFTVTGAEVQAMAPQPPAFPPEVAAKVKAGLDAYLAAGVVGPLESGTSPAGLEQAFTAGALGRLSASAPDRAAVLEEGTPLTGKVTQDRADAKLTVLSAPGGEIVLVAAQVDLSHRVDTGDAEVAVVRTGELVLVDDGGSWKVDAFDMRTARDTR